jgi:hypothetical protein
MSGAEGNWTKSVFVVSAIALMSFIRDADER